MNNQKAIIRESDVKRYKVLDDLTHKKLTGVQAAELLGVTSVHIS